MTKFYLLLSRYLTVLLIFTAAVASAQSRTVSGKVTSADDGSGMPGVSIAEKGTSNGVISDAEGNYTISVGPNAILVFSFVGTVTQEIPVGDQTSLSVQLASDVTELSEVVVVGYGVQEKKDVTGVVTAVSEKNFNRGAIVSPDQLISGKIAGVQITQNSGEPGGGSTIRIRGGTSISAGNEPLYVIDGVPVDNVGFPGGRNPLNFINASDIETFTVLKDAAAAAIYGSRAANGVIIITTKRGKAGMAPKITYDGYFTASTIAKKLDVFTADEYRNLTSAYSPASVINSLDPTASTDWQDRILQTATGQSHNISLTAGTEKAGYRVSVGHLQLDGIIKTSSTERSSLMFGIDQKLLNDDLTISANLKASQTKDRYNGGGIGGANNMAPTQPVYDENSPYGGFWEWTAPLGTKNPVAEIELTKHRGSAYRANGNLQFDYKFTNWVPGLRANLNLGTDIINSQRKFFQPSYLRAQFTGGNLGEIQLENIRRMTPLLEAYLNYAGKVDAIQAEYDVTAGYSYQDFISDQYGSNGRELESDNYGYNDPSVAGVTAAWSNPQESRLISFFGRVNVSVKDKYLFRASLRRDGSSRFGPSNRWGVFPAVALGWRISEEDFFSAAQDVVSSLKLRVSYGVNGNQEFGNYLFLSTYGLSNTFAQYQLGDAFYRTLRPTGVDPNIKWEETKSLNIGVDFGVMNDRITGELEFYNKDTDDLLFVVNIPAGTNVTNRVLTNIGSVRNRGVELTLNATAMDKGDFRWNVGVNLAHNKNEIISLDGSDDPNFKGYEAGGISGGVGNNIQVLKVGNAVGTFRTYQHKYENGKPLVDGVDHNEDGFINDADMYKDVNGDGSVNDQDRRPGKSANPKLLLGFTSNMTYKGFDLSFTLRGSFGNYAYNNVASSNAFLGKIQGFTISPENMPTSVLDTKFSDPQFFSNYYVENASFLRMDNITLGYSITQLDKAKIRVYATAQNLFVLTKYSGIDPEVLNGIDNNAYPRSRTFVIGVNIGL